MRLLYFADNQNYDLFTTCRAVITSLCIRSIIELTIKETGITKNLNQIIKFGAAGVANTVIDFAIFNLLFSLVGWPLLLANLLAASVAMVVSMYLNRRYVFGAVHGGYLGQAVKFLVVTLSGVYILQNTVIYLGLAVTHSLHMLAAFGGHELLLVNAIKAVGVAVSAVWNFVLYKHWVFRQPLLPSNVAAPESVSEDIK